jgi:hypothetical protein
VFKVTESRKLAFEKHFALNNSARDAILSNESVFADHEYQIFLATEAGNMLKYKIKTNTALQLKEKHSDSVFSLC